MSNHTEAKCVTWFCMSFAFLHKVSIWHNIFVHNYEVCSTPVQPQIISCGCTVISFFLHSCLFSQKNHYQYHYNDFSDYNVFLVIQETLQSMIYSAEVLQMNLFIYLLGSSTDYHYILLQRGGWHWQQWTKAIIASFELLPLNQIIIPYTFIHISKPWDKTITPSAFNFPPLLFKLTLQIYSDSQMMDVYQTCSMSLRAL